MCESNVASCCEQEVTSEARRTIMDELVCSNTCVVVDHCKVKHLKMVGEESCLRYENMHVQPPLRRLLRKTLSA